jgi:hypothetical protein
MARNKEPIPRLGEMLPDYEQARENYMLKAAMLAAKVSAVIELEQIKSPAVAADLKKLLDEFRAA